MASRDLVFVSYAHEDRKWLDRLRVFLKPYEKQGRLTVWADPYVPVGSKWRREIDAALARTRVGVTLVTPDFLASDFIIDEELPSLLDVVTAGDATIVAIPVSASVFDVLGLSEYQWALPPDKPLHGLRQPDRHAALVVVTHAIVAAAAVDEQDDDEPHEGRRAALALDAVPQGTRLGRLHAVPDQRPNFVPRPEVRDSVVHALLSDRKVVGVTGARRVGVHGLGGIGKSVIAIDVVGQEEIRRAFPDGIFWLTLGQQPKLLDLQAQLARMVTGGQVAFDSVPDGVQILTEQLAGKRALVVLDDLWSGSHAGAFDVLDSTSRLLVTSRDRGVVAEIGASEERLDVLSDEVARVLLAEWVGVEASDLPGEATGVLAQTGNLPLAVSLAGARIADGAVWAEMLRALEAGKLYYLDHPYGSVFASMQLGLDALTAEDRSRLLELAVIPEDEYVPSTVVARLWAQTAELTASATTQLLRVLERKALLYLAEDEGLIRVSLHDLQRDFLRLCIEDLPATHAAMVASYWPEKASLPTIPAGERYMWERMSYHLGEAAMADELRTLLLDPAWIRDKLAATDIATLREDFRLPLIHADAELVGAALRKSAHVVGADPNQLPGQLLGRLSGSATAEIEAFCDGIDRAAAGPWLRPITASLDPPGIGEVISMTGHTAPVTGVAVTPDGTHAVSCGVDRMVRVWDLETGTQRSLLEGHTDVVNAVAVTPDGAHAITVGNDRTVRMWELSTGTEGARLKVNVGRVNAVAITPDGTRAVFGGYDRKLQVWDLATDRPGTTLKGYADVVRALAVTPDGARVVSGSDDGRVRVWDLGTSSRIAQFKGHRGRINAVTVTPDGASAVTSGEDGTARVWDLDRGTDVVIFKGHNDAVNAVAVPARGTLAISGGKDETLRVWDLTTGRLTQSVR